MQKKYAIGIDIGGTNLRVALVSSGGEIVQKVKESTSEEILDSLLRAIDSLFSNDVVGIGIGVAGLISRKEGKVLSSPNLHQIEQINLMDEIKRRFDVPILVENDANSAAYGEMWVGVGRKFSSFILFTLGTGIGGGIIYKKKLLNISAEIGHMSINAEGDKCPCGNYGCLESYASARAILSKTVFHLEKGRESSLKGYHEGNIYKLTAEDVYKAALDGDNLAREMFKNAGRYLGIGIANMINIMSPEAIVLSGGLVGAWEIFVQEAIREASRRAFKELYDKVKILPSILMDDAGVIGSAGLLFHRISL